MNTLVEEFLKKQAKESEKKKKALLDDLGLYEKEYSPDNKQSAEYPESEWDDNNSTRYFKKVPIDISDKEFSEVLKYQCLTQATNKESTIAILFKAIAFIIFLICEIVWFVTTICDGDFECNVLFWSVVAINFFVLGEILQLLRNRKNKKYRCTFSGKDDMIGTILK